jgi:hypothetical protein
VIEVTRKILALATILMLVAMLAIPVLAAPATKIEEVTATLTITMTSVYTAHDHGILQVREGVATGTVTINIPGQDPLIGTVYAEFIGTMKLDHDPPGPWPNAETIMVGHPVFTFTGEGTTGTFEGVRHNKVIGFPVASYIDTRLDLHGTGDFLGQTLKLSYEGVGPAPLLEGYLLIPN